VASNLKKLKKKIKITSWPIWAASPAKHNAIIPVSQNSQEFRSSCTELEDNPNNKKNSILN